MKSTSSETAVCLPTGVIIDFGARLAARRGLSQPQVVEPWFKPGLWPGTDYNQIGHIMAAAAQLVRSGCADLGKIAQVLDGLSANAHATCYNVRLFEDRALAAERALHQANLPIPRQRKRRKFKPAVKGR